MPRPACLGGKGFGAPDVFDNAYYLALLKKPWLDPNDKMGSMIGLPSDHVLPEDPECVEVIQVRAMAQKPDLLLARKRPGGRRIPRTKGERDVWARWAGDTVRS